MILFREKCKLRQCPRINPKYLRNVHGQVPQIETRNKETVSDGLDTEDEHLKEIVNEILDRAWEGQTKKEGYTGRTGLVPWVDADKLKDNVMWVGVWGRSGGPEGGSVGEEEE